MSSYEFLLFLHLTAVAVWVGGATALHVLQLRARRTADPAGVTGFYAEAEFYSNRILTPASLVVVLSGFGLVSEGDWSLGDPWLLFGLAIFFVSALTGMLFLGPESGRLPETLEAHGLGSVEVQDRLARIELAVRIDLLLLYAVTLDMVVKPFL